MMTTYNLSLFFPYIAQYTINISIFLSKQQRINDAHKNLIKTEKIKYKLYNDY